MFVNIKGVRYNQDVIRSYEIEGTDVRFLVESRDFGQSAQEVREPFDNYEAAKAFCFKLDKALGLITKDARPAQPVPFGR